MKKKTIFIVLSLVIVISVCVPYFAGMMNGGLQYQVISQEQEAAILNEYQDEFALIERECGHQIDTIDNTTIEVIQETANRNIYNRDYRFSDLMTDISLAEANRAK